MKLGSAPRRFFEWKPILIALLLSISGCGDTDELPSKSSDAISARQTTEVPESKTRARLSLGDNNYELGVVFCIGTSMATITANDAQRRSDHPVVTVKMFDLAMTGGQSHDTVSAYFERDGYGENWALQDGAVSRDDDIVVASGTLKGSRLVPNEDGTRKSEPLESDDTKPFELRIEC